MSRTALAIFVKNTDLGRVKTRIAVDSDDVKALSIYKKLLNITKQNVLNIEVEKFVFYDREIDSTDIWDEAIFNKQLQVGNSLGDKMFQAFNLLSHNGFSKIILIGSDCPYVSDKIIKQAETALDDNNFVLGPSTDGGYYLIGMTKVTQVVFNEIEWSTEKVLQQTIDNISSISQSYFLLEPFTDIDHLKDWEDYIAKHN